MPIVYSVSDITSILSGIIKNEPTLQEVSVTGKVSVDNLPRVFWLNHEKNKIRCFIPGGNIDQFGSLLTAENTVVVHGKISLFPKISEYQILIDSVQSVRINETENNSLLTVSDITNKLVKTLANSSELKIHIRGEISESARQSGATFWFLKDIGNAIPAATGSQQIHCVCFDGGLVQDGILVNNGNQIRIKGRIQIWGGQSRYQINVTHLKPDDSTEQCQCSGCAQCTSANQCNRPREIANFESCVTCLPRPPDELYQLCRECYAISPDHETEVANAVCDYLNELGVQGFYPVTESQIQFGTRNGIADVTLTDANGSFAVIAECKGAGYVGHGIEQLKSYLSATDTRFGVFANRTDPSQWKFYENRRRNCVPEIGRSEFKLGVVKGLDLRPLLQDEIANLRQEIHRKLDNLLEERMQKLETSLADLRVELRRRGIINWLKNLISKETE